jgi:hypothetical protein
MIKRLALLALLALIVVPAGVMAAGTQGSGAGSQTGSAKVLQFQQGEQNQGSPGPAMISNMNGIATSDNKGNGDLLRIRSQDQLRSGDLLLNQTRNQVHARDMLQNQTRNQIHAGDFLQAVAGSGDKLQAMTHLRSQLRDGSCGNCPNLNATS